MVLDIRPHPSLGAAGSGGTAMIVQVTVALSGEAAAAGAVRFNINGRGHVLLAHGLTVEEQASYVALFTDPWDEVVFPSVPSQLSSEVGTERASA